MKKLIAVLLTCLLLAALTACSSNGEGKTRPTDGPSDAQPEYTVILDYIPNTNHTGMYVAIEKGYYVEEGFTVRIIEPTDLDSNTVVATGKADFGVTYQEDKYYVRDAFKALVAQGIYPENIKD